MTTLGKLVDSFDPKAVAQLSQAVEQELADIKSTSASCFMFSRSRDSYTRYLSWDIKGPIDQLSLHKVTDAFEDSVLNVNGDGMQLMVLKRLSSQYIPDTVSVHLPPTEYVKLALGLCFVLASLAVCVVLFF